MADGAPEWVQTEEGRALAQAALADIDRLHTLHPACALCGQRSITLDRYGLCSKVSDSHKTWRAEARAEDRKAHR
jgi:hypothetical protein